MFLWTRGEGLCWLRRTLFNCGDDRRITPTYSLIDACAAVCVEMLLKDASRARLLKYRVPFTHTLRSALLLCASKNTRNVFVCERRRMAWSRGRYVGVLMHQFTVSQNKEALHVIPRLTSPTADRFLKKSCRQTRTSVKLYCNKLIVK